eukprot:NODE_6_length_70510_cov_1.054395.p14 type:complete len:455 gc:universal NODE_6_length_70510_cov_1.054395:46270-44906(-)
MEDPAKQENSEISNQQMPNSEPINASPSSNANGQNIVDRGKPHGDTLIEPSNNTNIVNTPEANGLTLTWHNLHYTVPIKKDTKQILNGVSGEVRPGQLVAIMGSSGAGKSTLLNILAGRFDQGDIDGQILINGLPRDPLLFMRQIAYVEQDDLLFSMMTVKETVSFSAQLRLPSSVTKAKKLQNTADTIQQLGLSQCQNTKIGSSLKRGVSGGERKRASIAVEVVTDPKILFLDEPTSGLDAFIAYNIIETLKDLAVKQNKTILLTIHQPRETIMDLFDNVLLLSQGKPVFFGPTKNGIQHFSNLGHPCPRLTNPADHFIDIITPDLRSPEQKDASEKRILALQDAWSFKEPFSYSMIKQADYENFYKKQRFGMMKYQVFWIQEYFMLLTRDLREIFKNPIVLVATTAQSIIVLAILSAIFNGLDGGVAGVQNRLGFCFFLAVNLLFSNVMPTG